MAVSSDEQEAIANHLAAIIPDGATLQMGIGGIPDAVLRKLHNHKHLGIHTELFSDGVVDLVERGVITNERKTFHTGKIVAGFVIGTQRLYDFVDDNPIVELHPSEYINDPFNIAKNERMVSINSAIQVDVTGQVCADSMGTRFYSGVGGQVDFVRGAARSVGGMPIIAMPSTARNGQISRIVPMLTPGSGVITTRNDVHYIATEYGVADLYGRPIRDRVRALIDIAHPDFRAELAEQAGETYGVRQWLGVHLSEDNGAGETESPKEISEA
jgi:acetyl-CoA hydrolase